MASYFNNERRTFEGRHYRLTLASTPETMDLELDDVGPAPGRGLIALASCDDTSHELTVRVFTDAQPPMDMLDRFLATARAELPGSA